MTITERVIEESAKMFAAEGVKSIRMDDIASRLGMSKRTIYELFKDKDTLVELSLMRYLENAEKKQLSRIENIDNVLEQFLVLMDERTLRYNFTLMEGVKRFYPRIFDKVVDERNRTGAVKFKTKVAEGIREGLFLEDLNVDLTMAVFADSMIRLFVKSDQYMPNNISPADAFRYLVTYFFRGISTEKGIKIIDNYIKKPNR